MRTEVATASASDVADAARGCILKGLIGRIDAAGPYMLEDATDAARAYVRDNHWLIDKARAVHSDKLAIEIAQLAKIDREVAIEVFKPHPADLVIHSFNEFIAAKRIGRRG